MYTQRRFSFKRVLIWTKREIFFFFGLATLVTVLHELLCLDWLQIPLAPVGLVGTAVAFLIGFQNNAAYGRIWEARKVWGGIVNNSRSLVITLKDSFHMHGEGPRIDEPEELKIVAHRHIAWLTALRYAMRTTKTWEIDYRTQKGTANFDYNIPEHKESLEEAIKPHLSEEELAKVMAASHKPNAVMSLQSKHLRILTNEKKLWDFSLLNLQEILKELTALQGKSERIKNFPYPKQYGSIGYHFVHIFMWVLPFAIIPSFAKMGGEMLEAGTWGADYFVWANIPFTVMVTWIFNTMLRIGLAGENPFEGSPNDVPISNISRGITRDILEIVGEDPNKIPAPFENPSDVQM
jgi:putative membrane protein